MLNKKTLTAISIIVAIAVGLLTASEKLVGLYERVVKHIDYVKDNYKNLSKHYFFDDKSFYKGDGAYYTDKRGLEVSIGPKK